MASQKEDVIEEKQKKVARLDRLIPIYEAMERLAATKDWDVTFLQIQALREGIVQRIAMAETPDALLRLSGTINGIQLVADLVVGASTAADNRSKERERLQEELKEGLEG